MADLLENKLGRSLLENLELNVLNFRMEALLKNKLGLLFLFLNFGRFG